MGKQEIDLRPQKGMTEAQSNEHLRNFSEEAYRKKKTGNFDPTREHLNFEVGRGGKIIPVNKSYSIRKRIQDSFYARGIKDPNDRFIQAGTTKVQDGCQFYPWRLDRGYAETRLRKPEC